MFTKQQIYEIQNRRIFCWCIRSFWYAVRSLRREPLIRRGLSTASSHLHEWLRIVYNILRLHSRECKQCKQVKRPCRRRTVKQTRISVQHRWQSCCSTSAHPECKYISIIYMHMAIWQKATGVVGHDVTVFSGSSLCQFTQLVKRLHYQKMTLWSLFSKVCTLLSCTQKAELQQKALRSMHKLEPCKWVCCVRTGTTHPFTWRMHFGYLSPPWKGISQALLSYKPQSFICHFYAQSFINV